MKKSLLKVVRNFSKNPEKFRKIEKIENFQIFENQRKIKEKIENRKISIFRFFGNFRDFLKFFDQLSKVTFSSSHQVFIWKL